MGIGWREILGLLIGLGLCYVILDYALTNAPQNREAASEQTSEETESGETKKQSTPETSNENTRAVTVRVTGSYGQPFGANYGNLSSSRSVEGVIPAEYEARVSSSSSSGDYVSATAWKTTGDTRELRVQLVIDGTVVRDSATAEDYGATGARWNSNDPIESVAPQPAKTVPEKNKQKKAGETSVSQPK
ncbi:MAG: hypothetical protein WKF67_04850 [Rubrobacteraceae bacterium]